MQPARTAISDEHLRPTHGDLSDPETSRPAPVLDLANSECESDDEEELPDRESNTGSPLHESELAMHRLLELRRAQALTDRIEPPPHDIAGFTSVLGERLVSSATRFHTDIIPRSDKRRILMCARKVVGGMAFVHEMPMAGSGILR